MPVPFVPCGHNHTRREPQHSSTVTTCTKGRNAGIIQRMVLYTSIKSGSQEHRIAAPPHVTDLPLWSSHNNASDYLLSKAADVTLGVFRYKLPSH